MGKFETFEVEGLEEAMENNDYVHVEEIVIQIER